MKLVRKLVTIVLWTLLVAGSAAAQPAASLSGLVSDTSGGRLPGVTVEVLTEGAARPTNTTTTDANGTYRFATVRPGRYVVRFALDGFAKVEKAAIVAAGAAVEVTVALGVKNLSETVSVVANEVALAPTNATQGTTFSNATLSQLPTSSRNYTHVIVGDAGVNAPLPDRTGRGLNIATKPGTQAEDASQSLNPSVNGARPTNNCAAHQRRRRHEHAQRQRRPRQQRQHPARRARRGRSADGAALGVARPQRRRQHRAHHAVGHATGSPARRGYYFQNEKLNANEFFLNRAGMAKPEFRRNDAHRLARRPAAARTHALLRRRPAAAVSLGLREQREGRHRAAHRADRCAHGGDDCRRRQPVAPDRRSEDNPAFAQNFMNALAGVPGRPAGRAHRAVLRRSGGADVPRAHPVRHPPGRAEHPEHAARRPTPDPVADRRRAAAQGQRHLWLASICCSR